jgi:hypothetical protein
MKHKELYTVHVYVPNEGSKLVHRTNNLDEHEKFIEENGGDDVIPTKIFCSTSYDFSPTGVGIARLYYHTHGIETKSIHLSPETLEFLVEEFDFEN